MYISGVWLCYGQRYTECAVVSDELMTFLLSTNGALSVNCLIKKQKDTVSNRTVAMGVAVPSAVAVADLLSSASILPICLLICFNCRSSGCYRRWCLRCDCTWFCYCCIDWAVSVQSVSSFICNFHRFQNHACVFRIPVMPLFCADGRCFMYSITRFVLLWLPVFILYR